MLKANNCSIEHTEEVGLDCQSNIIKIFGNVNVYNVSKLWKQGLEHIEHFDSTVVDLQLITKSDSSVLALCTAWMRAARALNKKIKFTKFPSFINDIIHLSSLEDILKTSSKG